MELLVKHYIYRMVYLNTYNSFVTWTFQTHLTWPSHQGQLLMHGHCERFVLECRLQFGTGSCWCCRLGGSVQDLAPLEGCRGLTWVWGMEWNCFSHVQLGTRLQGGRLAWRLFVLTIRLHSFWQDNKVLQEEIRRYEQKLKQHQRRRMIEEQVFQFLIVPCSW